MAVRITSPGGPPKAAAQARPRRAGESGAAGTVVRSRETVQPAPVRRPELFPPHKMRCILFRLWRLVLSLREKRKLLMNWFLAQGTISSGIVEGMNNKAKLVMRRAYGFRTYRAVEVALYHNLGDLPEPQFTHRFW